MNTFFSCHFFFFFFLHAFTLPLFLSDAHIAAAQNSRHDILILHNIARATVGVGPVYWDNNLAAYALHYAYERSGDCDLIHSQGPYGENIFSGTADYSAAFAVKDWVSERRYYDYGRNSCAGGVDCGHYTQVVWRDTTSIGCARVPCNGGGVFLFAIIVLPAM